MQLFSRCSLVIKRIRRVGKSPQHGKPYPTKPLDSLRVRSVIVISYNFVTMFGYSQVGHLYLLLCGYIYYAYIPNQRTR
ncbi:hypothetical protein VCR15J2_640005 [Vibrio coralliirubri]|nr:hypothetical protein VCR15J2_640005 [Vibrio coralliirubri]